MINFNRIITLLCQSYTGIFRFKIMGNITSVITPFQVFNSIIGFITINMINLWKVIWVWYKKFSNKTMDWVIFIVKRNCGITFSIQIWFQKYFFTNRPYPSIRINNIIGIKGAPRSSRKPYLSGSTRLCHGDRRRNPHARTESPYVALDRRHTGAGSRDSHILSR